MGRWGRDDEVALIGRCAGGGDRGCGGAPVGRIGERERDRDVM